MATKFRFNYNNQTVDFDDYYVRSDIFTQGNLWSWGYNSYGQLGDNSTANRSSPIQDISYGTNWKQVVGGSYQVAAIKTDGTLWVWGYNDVGALGDNTTVNKSSPIQTVTGGNNWNQVAGAGYHIAAIKTDGTLWTWGFNSAGQLGDNTTIRKSSPVQTIAYGTNWKTVSCGGYHTAAIKTDSSLWLWGTNTWGQLGDNTFSNRSSPMQTISGGTNWNFVSCGYRYTAAIKTDGTLWTWGRNSYGQLGDNIVIHRSSPVQIISGGIDWKQVFCGYNHTAAIKTDGTLWIWGGNAYGQLGDNTTVNKSSPIQTVTGGNNWKQIALGRFHTAAIKTDGTLWMWGRNSYGILGDNTIIHRSSPVQTINLGNNWKTVSCGMWNTAAITYIN